jgi:hypothetical protein
LKRHGLDPISLVFGLLFSLVGLSFVGGNRSAADLSTVWLWAPPVLALGILAVLWGLKLAIRRNGGPETDTTAEGLGEEPEAEEGDGRR